MTPSTPQQDLATQWTTARQLYPIYFELAREFVIDVKPCADLEGDAESPSKEAVEQANQWLDTMDEVIQVHQLRQFLQTTALVNQDGLVSLIRHFLTKAKKTEPERDKIDFLLVQYFSQLAPTGLPDDEVDLGYVAEALSGVLGPIDLKAPVWLNALDRVLESARKCKSLDELLHGGVLEQGRKAKSQSGELFYLPVALAAFTRFGYLMRRAFFRLMIGDLNIILDGLNELEEKGIQTIDCRRAQFSAEEPIMRLRMICQSWKVMFQAEYSSGQPLRMLVDLRASVENALGTKTADSQNAAQPASNSVSMQTEGARSMAAAAGAEAAAKTPKATTRMTEGKKPEAAKKVAETQPARDAASSEAPEFEVSGGAGWSSDAQPESKN